MSASDPLHESYRRLTLALIEKELTISAMESCTGGLIASLITDTEGASRVLRGSFVTYSNEAKLRGGVPAEVLETYGVYSHETARAMAAAAARAYGADIGVGVTGSLGRTDPENAGSVPGEVWFAISAEGEEKSFFLRLGENGSRVDGKREIAAAIAEALFKRISF